MGKQGPCRHCGVTYTPLWRNGPPEKPVLCNACGSRWRTRGSLANYTPLHARELINLEEPKFAKVKIIYNMPKVEKLQKRRLISGMVENKHESPFSETLEEDTSSSPAISYSESCTPLGNTDASDWTGSAQSKTWDSLFPSKKRSVIRSTHSSVEKLTKDLCSIWHEQQSSNLSGTSDDDLLFEDETAIGSVEIGNGGVLLRHPWSKTVEESEASSLPIYDKLVYGAHSSSACFSSTSQLTKENDMRDRFSPDILNMLQDTDSLLYSADLEEKKQKQVTGKNIAERAKDFYQHSNLTLSQRPCERENQHLLESQVTTTMRSPKQVHGNISTFPPFKKSWFLNSREAEPQVIYDAEDIVDNEGTCFSQRSIFTSPTDKSSMLQLTDENSDHGLLINVGCNTATFPSVQIFHNHSRIQKAVSNCSLAESRAANEEEILSHFNAASFSSQ